MNLNRFLTRIQLFFGKVIRFTRKLLVSLENHIFVQENIFFGKPFFYKETSCCLENNILYQEIVCFLKTLVFAWKPLLFGYPDDFCSRKLLFWGKKIMLLTEKLLVFWENQIVA